MENHPKKDPKIRIWKIIITLIVLIAGFLIFIAYSNYKETLKTPLNPDNTDEISILIRQGDLTKEIGNNLEEKEIITSPTTFYWYMRLNNLATDIVPGRFIISPSMTIPEIAEKITSASNSETIITIQEGLTIKDIDKKLSEIYGTEEGEFIEAVKNFDGYDNYDFISKIFLTQASNLELPLEGYLYPDTYFLEPIELEAEDVIYKCLNNFNKKLKDLFSEIEKSGKSLHEIITMASIIEKEVIGTEDKKIVSGILWKRLNENWKLDADATLLYITDDREITATDLAIDSPYNTRKLKGLPPGPICNPSLDSIEAAIYPTESKYWFYLTAKDGQTIYAKTNEEHEQNKANHL